MRRLQVQRRAPSNTIGYAEEQANTLTADWHAPAVFPLQGNMIGRADSAGPAGKGYGMPGDPAMVASEIGENSMGSDPMLVRRLTPLECERLQGFPDGHTLIAWKGKPAEECPDGPALQGNRQLDGGPCHEMDRQAYRGGRCELGGGLPVSFKGAPFGVPLFLW